MNMFYRGFLAASFGGSLLVPYVHAEEAPSLVEALKAGSAQLHLRARAENVEQDNALDDATATTLKTRLSYTSATYRGLGVHLSFDDTTELGSQDYSDGVTARGTSVIADPEVTEVNEAYLSYTTDNTSTKYGRQRILLNNQRFVGGVGWRQDEQTYDGLTLWSSPTENVSLFAGYVTQVNRIFAETADHSHETVLLNGQYKSAFGEATLYGYLIDNKTIASLSSNTFGLRWEGVAGQAISYTLEYAHQSDSADNPSDYKTDYMLAELTWTMKAGDIGVSLKPGYEKLGSDEGDAFSTPLATLHAFQGWTDGFLTTPENGVVDTYVSFGSTLAGYSLSAIYHQFESDALNFDYGSELDLSLGKKIGAVNLLLKYADYSADEYWVDTTKVWLTASTTF